MADEKYVANVVLEGGAEQSKMEKLHAFQEAEGYVIDAGSSESGVKLAEDGRTRLIPQPSDDPEDPLNWTWKRKHVILFVVSLVSLLPDYGSATGAVTLQVQAKQWGMTPDHVNHSQAGNVFMIGIGGVVAVALSAYFGRLPVVFWFMVVSVVTSAWCAGATTFESFMAARILNGFFATVTQGGGLMFIQDMFFFHERARKINIWSSFVIVSPFLGPMMTAFMLTTLDWPAPFWVYTAMTSAAFVLVILFLQETYYDRSMPAAHQPPKGSRVERLTGVAQWKSRHLRNTFGEACWRTFSILLKPTAFLGVFFYMMTFAWSVGVNTTLSIFLTPLYGFGPREIGFFYFTPIVATILGEVTGHWLHEHLARRYIRQHNGQFEPEVRLRAVYISTPLMTLGLAMLGQCLGNDWHYMTTSFSWGLYIFGIMITTVAVASYLLDSYPEASGEVSAWINCGRTTVGFVISYLQVPWAEKQGTKTSFGIQAAVVGLSFFIALAILRWGKQLRVWSGPLNFRTA